MRNLGAGVGRPWSKGDQSLGAFRRRLNDNSCSLSGWFSATLRPSGCDDDGPGHEIQVGCNMAATVMCEGIP
jgi:hypothetical protein